MYSMFIQIGFQNRINLGTVTNFMKCIHKELIINGQAFNKCLRTLPSKDIECLTYNGAQNVTLDGTLVRNQTELPERIESSWH